LILTGNGDVLEPESGIAAIGSGGNYALSAARALVDYEDRSREDLPASAMAYRQRGLRLHQRQSHARDDRRRCMSAVAIRAFIKLSFPEFPLP
jgi:hypothetical protein